MIARRVGQVLFESQVPLCRLDGSMAEGHLDLFELRSALVSEPGVGAAEIVRCKTSQFEPKRIFPHNKPDAFRAQRFMGKPSPSVQRPEHPSRADSRSCAPFVDSEFRPGRHWNGADAAV